jgi:hypothetical protein
VYASGVLTSINFEGVFETNLEEFFETTFNDNILPPKQHKPETAIKRHNDFCSKNNSSKTILGLLPHPIQEHTPL